MGDPGTLRGRAQEKFSNEAANPGTQYTLPTTLRHLVRCFLVNSTDASCARLTASPGTAEPRIYS